MPDFFSAINDLFSEDIEREFNEQVGQTRAQMMHDFDEFKFDGPASEKVIDLGKDEYQVIEPNNTKALMKL